MRDLLMVAFHFPPIGVSSGYLRTLAFCRDLLEYGWRATVLTVRPSAYEVVRSDMLGMIPADVEVIRTGALDSARHLAIAGRHLQALAVPDRWASWLATAIPAGVRAAKRRSAALVWSTYPIATAHVAAAAISRWTGLPWIADFRDPMVEQDERTGEWMPRGRVLRQARLGIERLAVRRAARLVFCTEGARRIVAGRYGLAPERAAVIENGFDEQSFATLAAPTSRPRARPVTLLHSGVIYPTPDRDPTPFVDAVAALKREGILDAGNFRVVLRATGHDAIMRGIIDARQCADLIAIEPPIPYQDALREMLEADGLIVFQGYTSNPAIPAKVYEYLRAGRPILALVDAAGDTAALLRRAGVGAFADPISARAIEVTLREFIEALRRGEGSIVPIAERDRYARRHRAHELAAELARVAGVAR